MPELDSLQPQAATAEVSNVGDAAVHSSAQETGQLLGLLSSVKRYSKTAAQRNKQEAHLLTSSISQLLLSQTPNRASDTDNTIQIMSRESIYDV